jgi:hypothetical protein
MINYDTSSSVTNTSYNYYKIDKLKGDYYYTLIKARGSVTAGNPKKEKVKKTSFMFDPTGIGEAWPKKKSK